MNSNLILEKLEGVKQRFDEVGKLISDHEIIADMKRYVQLNKEYKELEPVVKAYNEYKNILSNIESAKENPRFLEALRMLASYPDDEIQNRFRYKKRLKAIETSTEM